ncbi:hypothetical protein [Sphingomonas sp. LR55]|uniref:hypothetical protein n=1 Tax=Sphingomonas sp. LR55 TaxID=3050231 RepID=UPI002FE0F1F3
MEQERDADIDRCPGRIEQRDDRRPGQRAAHRIEIAHRLATLADRRAIGAKNPQQDARRGLTFEPRARAQQQPHPHRVEDREHDQRQHQDQRQQQQGRTAARRHHTVVHLKHEDRRDEVQDVHQS